MTRQCRTCGGVIYNRKAKNLFQMENTDILVNIEMVSGTTLLNEPDLPNSICACCLLDLNQAVVFRERCNKTQERFLQRREWQASNDDEVKDSMDMQPNDGVQLLNNDYADLQVEDMLDYTEGDMYSIGGDTEVDEDVETTQDAELTEETENLISAVQKEMLRFCDDDSDHQETNEEVESSSSPPTKQITKSPLITTATKAAERDRAVTAVKRKPYMSWKNLTEEEALERKREQRRRDCVCEQCGRHFTDQSNFKLHMLRHTGVKNFACPECGKTFYTEPLMTLHVRIVHNGEKPYVCKYCGKSFHNSTSRIIHERIHTNARPYSCGYCEKSFVSASGRKRHELVHTGARPFYCATCDQPFKRSTHLKAHLKSKLHINRASRQHHKAQLEEAES
ncbi:transcription factor Ouib [Drosophila tropicalis]|uniref:transcription factor Ouib n=1 Tax=Drosophila tropicalis TaxID=46794 RepID=UPI0035AB8663